MTKRLTLAIGILFGAAFVLGAFFTVFVWQAVRRTESMPMASTKPQVPVGAALDALLPAGRSGGAQAELVDLDGDGAPELVIGYSVKNPSTIAGPRTSPWLRAYQYRGGSWQLISEFSFPLDPQATNAAEWQLIGGAPSFERKDIDGDHREELFIHLGIGDAFFRAEAIVVWREGALSWLPLRGEGGALVLPIFRDGSTAAESWRLLLEDANGGGGLDLIVTHGLFDAGAHGPRFTYQIYVEHGNGVYVFDADLSRTLTVARNRQQ